MRIAAEETKSCAENYFSEHEIINLIRINRILIMIIEKSIRRIDLLIMKNKKSIQINDFLITIIVISIDIIILSITINNFSY